MLWPSPPLSMHRLLSLVAPPPLSPRCRHYCRANACLIAPLSRQRLVVASSPLLLHQCLSCRADASLVAPPPLLLPCGLWRLDIVDVPPAYHVRSFCMTLLPPPAIVRPWPRQRRRCGIPAVIQFDAVIVIVIVVIQGLDILCCGHRHLSRCAVSSLSLRRRLYRHAAAIIAAPTPVSLRLSCASGWLLHRHLSRCTSVSLVMPAPLSLLRHLSCCAAASLLVAPHLSRLVVASQTILTCRRLSCRT